MKFEIEFSEKELQDLLFVNLRRRNNGSVGYSHIFREVYVNGSVADLVAYSPYHPGFIHIYECKMFSDKDRPRLDRQLRDYAEVADAVTVVCFGKIMENIPKHINNMVARIKNGKLVYEHVGDGHKFTGMIPLEMRNLKARLKFIKDITNTWDSKSRYSNKIITYLERKIKKAEKKD